MNSPERSESAATAPPAAVAHVRRAEDGGDPLWHGLEDHLRAVASLAGECAQSFDAARWAQLAGLWHDLGKYRSGFQRYIHQAVDADAHIEGRVQDRDKTHSAAGAVHALKLFEQRFGPTGAAVARLLAYVIAGHHAGLADWTAGLDDRLLGQRRDDSEREHAEALQACRVAAPDLLELPADFDLRAACASIPGAGSAHRLAASMFVRMLFSALVDADFRDTEAFMNPARNAGRQGFPPIATYLDQLDRHLDDKAQAVARAGRGDEPVMRARADVLGRCRAKAPLPPGVFSLTVPTGGGKTLSSLAFALGHARHHAKRRVVYVIPYTSIIEQTAQVFADIFGADRLVEHHSQADGDARLETHRTRLACENWDAPLVVTTNVQLFESLFAARTSRCRKLHNLADSVIVLDEAQLLPPEFLQPILDALNVLVAHYGVTLLLCTATQPALTTRSEFDARKTLRGLPPPTEIIDDPAALFAALERVRLRWPADLNAPVDWPALLPELTTHDCVLTIVNTRADALALTQALPAGTLHLSAAMCGAHRKQVIDQIRQRLQARHGGDPAPLRVVSTQLVEAGVDIDFPVVYRALAGLDSIAQAAGRCNREGRLERGEVVVFVRDIPRVLSSMRKGAEATRSVRAIVVDEALSPDSFERYFRLFYAGLSLDAKDIVVDLTRDAAKLEFAFRSVAERFRLIDDAEQATLVVPYHRHDAAHAQLEPLFAKLEAGETDRWLIRQVQRYTVSVRRRLLERWQAAGDVREVVPGLFLLVDELLYDGRFGLLPQGKPLDAASLVQ